MVQIVIEETACEIRRAPADEMFVDGDPGEHAFEITLTDNLTLYLRQDDAEDLYNTLALHFAGL